MLSKAVDESVAFLEGSARKILSEDTFAKLRNSCEEDLSDVDPYQQAVLSKPQNYIDGQWVQGPVIMD